MLATRLERVMPPLNLTLLKVDVIYLMPTLDVNLIKYLAYTGWHMLAKGSNNEGQVW